jgi:hypothetical protein
MSVLGNKADEGRGFSPSAFVVSSRKCTGFAEWVIMEWPIPAQGGDIFHLPPDLAATYVETLPRARAASHLNASFSSASHTSNSQ